MLIIDNIAQVVFATVATKTNVSVLLALAKLTVYVLPKDLILVDAPNATVNAAPCPEMPMRDPTANVVGSVMVVGEELVNIYPVFTAADMDELAFAPHTIEEGYPVQFCKLPDEGVPSAGVVKLGDILPANAPVPDCPDNDTPTALIVAISFLSLN